MPSGRRLDNEPRDASKSKKGVQGRRGALARVPGAPECAGLGQVGKPVVTDFRRNAVRRAERLVGAKAQRYVLAHPTGRQASFPPWEEPLAGESKRHVALIVVAHTTHAGRWGIPADCGAMRMGRDVLPVPHSLIPEIVIAQQGRQFLKAIVPG